MIAGVLAAICILSLDSVEGACLNCEAPYGPYCCKTSFRGQCCEYPLDDRAAQSYAKMTPLEKHVRNKEQGRKSGKIIINTPLPPIIESEYFG